MLITAEKYISLMNMNGYDMCATEMEMLTYESVYNHRKSICEYIPIDIIYQLIGAQPLQLLSVKQDIGGLTVVTFYCQVNHWTTYSQYEFRVILPHNHGLYKNGISIRDLHNNAIACEVWCKLQPYSYMGYLNDRSECLIHMKDGLIAGL